jgi:hypothetical protein
MKSRSIIDQITRNVAAIVAMNAILRINCEKKVVSYAHEVTAQATIYADKLMENLGKGDGQ